MLTKRAFIGRVESAVVVSLLWNVFLFAARLHCEREDQI